MEDSQLPTLQNITVKLLVTRLAVFLLVIILVIISAAYIGGQNLIKGQKSKTMMLANMAGTYMNAAKQAILFLADDLPKHKDLGTFQSHNPLFDALYVIGKDGKLAAISPPNPDMPIGMDLSTQPIFNPNQKDLVVSHPFIAAQTGDPTVNISVPLTNQDGILIGQLSLKGLQDNLADILKDQANILFIVDQNGYFLIHEDYEKVRRQENIGDWSIMERIRAGQPHHVDFFGQESLISTIEAVPHTGWHAVTQLSIATAYGSFLIPALSGFTLAFIFFVVLIFHEQLSILRQLVAPLQELGHQAQRMADGNYKVGESFFSQAAPYAEVCNLAGSFQRMEQAVQSRESALLLSETRFRHIFENSPVSLLEEDFSHLKIYFDKLGEVGIHDWWAYFENHPQEVGNCATLIKILDLNKASLDLLRMWDRREQFSNLAMILSEQSYDVFKAELISLAEGNTVFEAENTYRTLANTSIYANMRLIILPGYENTWSRVLISLSDITERQQTEKALQESETNFRTFFDTIEDMIMVSTVDGRIMYSNSALIDKLDYDFVEFYGMYSLDLYTRNKRKQAENDIAAILRGERISCLVPLETKHGSLIPVETRVWLGNWDGIECVFSICKDLRAEQEAQLRFERLFRSNPNLMAVTTLDGKFSDVNDAFLENLGYNLLDVIGKTAEQLDLFTLPGIQSEIGKRLREQKRLQNLELEVRRNDGQLLHGLLYGELIESQGRVNYLIVMVDISELKRTELALAQERNLLRTLIDNIPDPIYAMDCAGRKTLVNTADLAFMGLKQESEALGKTDAELYGEEQAKNLMGADQLVLNNDQSFLGFEELLQDAAGKEHWFLTSKIPLHDLEGEVTGLVGIGRDITQLKQAEEKLREMAVQDDLTGLNNRRGFMMLAAQHLKIADRMQENAVLFFADLDELKWINDNLGHKAGDQALVDTANILKHIFRSSDIIARLGGDEFVGLVIETHQNVTDIIMERLQEQIEAHNLQAQRSYKLSVSIGTALYDHLKPDLLENLLTRADASMYEQKKAHKACRGIHAVG